MRLARRPSIGLLVILSLVCARAGAEDQPTAAVRAAIEQNTLRFVKAFNEGDTQAMAGFWTEHGDFVGENGRKILFREQVKARAAHAPENIKAEDIVRPVLSMTVDGIRLSTPRVATVDGTSVFRTHPGAPAVHCRYTAIWVQQDNQQWQLDCVRENLIPAGAHHAHLQELEWMVGTWTASGDSPEITTTLKWSGDGNYLERTFHARLPGRPDHTGTQRIGWDPRREQFRSWTFANDGSFSQALWIPIENGWEAETSGITASGQAAGSVTRIVQIDENTMQWESVESTVDGHPLPDLKLRLTRKASK